MGLRLSHQPGGPRGRGALPPRDRGAGAGFLTRVRLPHPFGWPQVVSLIVDRAVARESVPNPGVMPGAGEPGSGAYLAQASRAVSRPEPVSEPRMRRGRGAGGDTA